MNTLKNLFILILLNAAIISCSSESGSGSYSGPKTTKKTEFRVKSVKYKNNELSVLGSNLTLVKNAKAKYHGTEVDFSIVKSSNNELTLKLREKIILPVNMAIELFFTNAEASEVFPVVFKLEDGQITTESIADKSITLEKLKDAGANDGAVISWDNETQEWIAKELNFEKMTLFKGTWDASTGALPSDDPLEGDTYIVSNEGQTQVNDINQWYSGDYIIFTQEGWKRIANTGAIQSVNGQTGAVVLDSDDIEEGEVNLFYNSTRARQDSVEDQINAMETLKAPSQRAVYDALSQKADVSTINTELDNKQESLSDGDVTSSLIASEAIDESKIKGLSNSCSQGEVIASKGDGSFECLSNKVELDEQEVLEANVFNGAISDLKMKGISTSCSSGQVLVTNGDGSFSCSQKDEPIQDLSITNNLVAEQAITVSKLEGTSTCRSGQVLVVNSQGFICEDKLDDSSVTEAKLADMAVSTSKLKGFDQSCLAGQVLVVDSEEGSIRCETKDEPLGENSVTELNLQNQIVSNTKIKGVNSNCADGEVLLSNGDGSFRCGLKTDPLANSSIGETLISDQSISNLKIKGITENCPLGMVLTSNADGSFSCSVKDEPLAPSSINEALIANESVSSLKLKGIDSLCGDGMVYVSNGDGSFRCEIKDELVADSAINEQMIEDESISNTKIKGITQNCQSGEVLVANGDGSFQCAQKDDEISPSSIVEEKLAAQSVNNLAIKGITENCVEGQVLVANGDGSFTCQAKDDDIENGSLSGAKITSSTISDIKLSGISTSCASGEVYVAVGDGSFRCEAKDAPVGSGAITESSISDQAISNLKIKGITQNCQNGEVLVALGDGTFECQPKDNPLANSSVGTNELADNSISSAKVQSEAISDIKLAGITSSCPDSMVYVSNSDGSFRCEVKDEPIGEGQIVNSNLAQGEIKADKLSGNTLCSPGQVLSVDPLGDFTCVDNKVELIDLEVTEQKIANNSIGDVKLKGIQTSCLHGESLVSDGSGGFTCTLKADPLTSNSVTTQYLDNQSVTESKIAGLSTSCSNNESLVSNGDGTFKCEARLEVISSGSIQEAMIANGVVSSSKLKGSPSCSVGEVLTLNSTTGNFECIQNKVAIDNQEITSEKIANLAVSESKLANDSVSTQKLANNSVTSDKLEDSSIVESKLSAQSVSQTKLKGITESCPSGQFLMTGENGELGCSGNYELINYGGINLPDTLSATISNTGQIVSTDYDWLICSSTPTSNPFTCTFKPGVFTVTPSCTISTISPTHPRTAKFDSKNSSGFTISTFNTTSGGGSSVPFDIICKKQLADARQGVIVNTAIPDQSIDNRKISGLTENCPDGGVLVTNGDGTFRCETYQALGLQSIQDTNISGIESPCQEGEYLSSNGTSGFTCIESPFARYEEVVRSETLAVFISQGGTATQKGNWISSVNKTSTGFYEINIVAGLNIRGYACASGTHANGNDMSIDVAYATDNQLTVRTKNSGSFIDSNFSLICEKNNGSDTMLIYKALPRVIDNVNEFGFEVDITNGVNCTKSLEFPSSLPITCSFKSTGTLSLDWSSVGLDNTPMCTCTPKSTSGRLGCAYSNMSNNGGDFSIADVTTATNGAVAIRCTKTGSDYKMPTVQPTVVGQTRNSYADVNLINNTSESCEINQTGELSVNPRCFTWIESVVGSGTGSVNVQYKNGAFSERPFCSCSVNDNEGMGCFLTNKSVNGITVITESRATSVNGPADITLRCDGPK